MIDILDIRKKELSQIQNIMTQLVVCKREIPDIYSIDGILHVFFAIIYI